FIHRFLMSARILILLMNQSTPLSAMTHHISCIGVFMFLVLLAETRRFFTYTFQFSKMMMKLIRIISRFLANMMVYYFGMVIIIFCSIVLPAQSIIIIFGVSFV